MQWCGAKEGKSEYRVAPQRFYFSSAVFLTGRHHIVEFFETNLPIAVDVSFQDHFV